MISKFVSCFAFSANSWKNKNKDSSMSCQRNTKIEKALFTCLVGSPVSSCQVGVFAKLVKSCACLFLFCKTNQILQSCSFDVFVFFIHNHLKGYVRQK